MRRNNAEAVLQMLTNADQGADWFIHEVNPAWAGLFLQDEWLEQPEAVELVKGLSKAAPLLFFFDADEYGWGYRLFAGGEERAAKAFEVQTPEPSEWTVSTSEDEAKVFREFGLKGPRRHRRRTVSPRQVQERPRHRRVHLDELLLSV